MNRFTTSDGLSLAYWDEGAGVPVLCLAGLTRNRMDFDDVAAKIGGEVRLVRMDYRGRGASDWALDHTTYSIPREALDAIELLNHLGIERALILGTSRGGLIAMTLAATAKDRLLGVILNDIGPEIAEVGLDFIKTYIGRAPEAKTYTALGTAMAGALETVFTGVTAARWAACAPRWFEETPEGLTLQYDAKLRDAVLEAGAQPMPDLWPLFDALEGLPIGLIRGANSDILTSDTAAEMRRRRPDMAFAEIPDRGHVPFLDEPEALAVIRAVIAKVSS